jgi:NADH-ubiquinone oxidoreductase chain 4L
MILALVLYLIAILGFILNRKNIIHMLLCLELMLLSIALLILVSSLAFDDLVGQAYAIYIISIAGAESAIGLAILVTFYRLNGTIGITQMTLRGQVQAVNQSKPNPQISPRALNPVGSRKQHYWSGASPSTS